MERMLQTHHESFGKPKPEKFFAIKLNRVMLNDAEHQEWSLV